MVTAVCLLLKFLRHVSRDVSIASTALLGSWCPSMISPFGDGLEVYGHGLGKLVLQKWPCLHRWCVCVCVCGGAMAGTGAVLYYGYCVATVIDSVTSRVVRRPPLAGESRRRRRPVREL